MGVSEWRRLPIGCVATIRSGFPFKSGDWQDTGVPVVKITNVRAGRVDLEGCSYVGESVAEAASGFLVKRDDILITMSGEIGSVGIYRYEERALLNQRVGRVEPLADAEVDDRFLGFALQAPRVKTEFEAIAYGAAQPNISPTLIGQVEVDLPDLKMQRRIASVLRSIDDLAENNRRRTALLEQIAESIYREWFVDFRYPNYEGDEMMNSALGPIPVDWSVRSFNDLAGYLNGFAFKPAHWGEVGIPIVKIKELKRGLAASTPRCDGDDIAPIYRIETGDLLFSWSAHLDAYLWSWGPGLLNQHLFKVTPADGVAKSWLYLTLRNRMEEFRSRSQGTTMKHIKRGALAEVLAVVPSARVMRAFDDAVSPLIDELLILSSIRPPLESLRGKLLPRLVTGVIDISHIDIAGMLEESAA